jgi:hypothetical protein
MELESKSAAIKKRLLEKGITICQGENIEDSCSDYDYAKYYKYVFHYIPNCLKSLKSTYNFYVVGGIAIDAHLGNNFLGSPDWDIQVVGDIKNLINFTNDLIELIKPYILDTICAQAVASEEPDNQGMLVFKKDVIQIATISKEGCVLLPLDISIGPETKTTEIDGIDYLNVEELFIEVKRMLKIRERGLAQDRLMVWDCKEGLPETFDKTYNKLKNVIKISYGKNSLKNFKDDKDSDWVDYEGEEGFENYVKKEIFNQISGFTKTCLNNEAKLLKKSQKLEQTGLRISALEKALG